MTHPPVVQFGSPRVLLSVANAHECIRAGHGETLLTVRTLDNVSCDVHTGELLLLRGPVAGGAFSLLRALEGNAPRIRARRRMAEHVHIRRGTIDEPAAQTIIDAWREPLRAPSARRQSSRVPVVYLLRVRCDAPPDAPTHSNDVARSWSQWAGTVRSSGGAIVLAISSTASAAQNETRATNRDTRSTMTMIHEPRRKPSPPIRILTLHAGQLLSVRPTSRLECLDGTCAIRGRCVSYPCSTASPPP